VQVHENITTIPVISGSLFACPDDSTLLSVNPSFSSYLWSSGDTTNPVALPAGNYFVNTIDSNACNTQSATITILNHSVSVPSISGDTICCTNDSIVLTASAGFTAYSWSNGSNFSSATLPPGNYVVSVGDANNCLTKSADFTVSSYPFTLPTTSGTSNFCFGDSVLWTINPAYPHYLWSSGDTIQNTFLQSGTHYAIVQDAYNCTFKSSIFTLQNYPAQSPTILGKNYLCNNDSLLLLAPSGFSQIQWSTGATSNSIFAQNGNYTLTGRDSNNCLSISLPHSVVISQPVVNIVGAQTICDQDSTSLSLSLTFTDYNWSNGSQNASVWVRDGNYSVEIHDSIGCKGSASIVIASYFLPTAFFIHEPPVAEINEPIQFFNASQGNGDTVISYTWTLSNNALLSNLPNPILVFDEEGNKVITLTVTTNNGCIDSYSETIEVIKSIKIPNIITPNGDGLNDIFEIVNLDLSKSNRLVVFDRWGKLVYSSNKYQNDWNAEKLDDGVYYFTLQIEGNKELKGSLTVLH
jgi:gliding motility-associated-like protein